MYSDKATHRYRLNIKKRSALFRAIVSNSTPVISIRDSLAQFLARTNEFGEANSLLVQGKVNKGSADGKAQPRFPAGESNSRSVCQWPNMVDDFILQYFREGGGEVGRFQEVYRLDFRQVANVDLNVVGSSFTHDGVQWRTPQNVPGGDTSDMMPANGSFGIVDNGLKLSNGALGVRMAPSARTCTFIFADLFAIGQNTKSPFVVDPSAKWRFEVYLFSQDNVAAPKQHSGVAIYRPSPAVIPELLGSEALWRSGIGFSGGSSGAAMGLGGIDGATEWHQPGVPGGRIASITHISGATKDLMTGTWDHPRDDFPQPQDLKWLASPPTPKDGQGAVSDPRLGFRVAVYHCSGSAVSPNYGGIIQQLRILRG